MAVAPMSTYSSPSSSKARSTRSISSRSTFLAYRVAPGSSNGASETSDALAEIAHELTPENRALLALGGVLREIAQDVKGGLVACGRFLAPAPRPLEAR